MAEEKPTRPQDEEANEDRRKPVHPPTPDPPTDAPPPDPATQPIPPGETKKGD